jgi:plastocyanin
VKRVAICAAVAVAAAGVAGVATEASGKPAAQRLKLKASDAGGKLRFNKKTLNAKVGKVTITVTNPSSNSLPHAVEVEGKGIEKESKKAQPGKRASVKVTLKKKGTYEFYCPVGQHKQAGMKGKLVVS